MKCPFCRSQDSAVLESRVVDEGRGLRRRRKCSHCNKRFTTYETVQKLTIWVVKKDGKREPFDKEKVSSGILRAIRKRPVSLDEVRKIVDQIESTVYKLGKNEIKSSFIGREVLNKLKRTDKVAWLRFASVYLEFENLSDFEKAIEKSHANTN